MSLFGRTVAALGTAVLVVVLAGCAPAHHPGGAVTHPASAASAAASTSATPSASPSVASAPQTPPLVGGDCTKLLDSASLAASLGASTHSSVDAVAPVVAVVGGIGCDYFFGKSLDHALTEVVVVVAPSAIADPSEVKVSLRSPQCGPDWRGSGSDCGSTASVAGWWYSLDVYDPHKPASTAVVRVSFEAITSDLESTLKANPAPSVNLVQPFNCGALAPAGVLESVDGDPTILSAADLLAGPTSCAYALSQSGAGSGFTIYPGSTSAYAQCVHQTNGEGSPITVPGVETAFEPKQDPTQLQDSVFCATDGKSTVTVWGDALDFSVADTLGPTLTPLFTAAVPAATPWTASLAAPSASNTVQPLGGGDCTKLLNPKALAAALAATKLVSAEVNDPLLETVGGLDCNYDFGTPAEVSLRVAPRAIANPAELQASLSPPVCQADEGDYSLNCVATVTVADWWYSLSVGGLDPDSLPTAPGGSFTTIIANLDKSLMSTAAPGRVNAIQPFDCQSAKTGGVPVTGSRGTPGDVGDGLTMEGSFTKIYEVAMLLAAPETCEFTLPHPAAPWELTVYPDSTAAYHACTQLAQGDDKPISVPGVKTAVAFVLSNPAACATDGKSTVLAQLYDPDAGSFTATARNTLGSLLVPVFAAIK